MGLRWRQCGNDDLQLGQDHAHQRNVVNGLGKMAIHVGAATDIPVRRLQTRATKTTPFD